MLFTVCHFSSSTHPCNHKCMKMLFYTATAPDNYMLTGRGSEVSSLRRFRDPQKWTRFGWPKVLPLIVMLLKTCFLPELSLKAGHFGRVPRVSLSASITYYLQGDPSARGKGYVDISSVSG